MRGILLSVFATFALGCLYMTQAEAGGRFTMKMTRYRNPRHRKWNGKCCDIGFFMCAKCDTYFRICVTQGDVPSSYSHGTCSVLRQEYGRYQHFHDVFSMNYGVSRPLSSFSGKPYIGVLVESWDKDTFTKDDFIDRFSYKLNAAPPGQTRRVTLRGRRASLSVEFRVNCDTYYYGRNCDVFCRPRRDSSGHYRCNAKGGKVCLQGWYDNSCTKYCVPSRDSDPAQYTCDHHGNKVCNKGWRGPECNTCLNGWYGPRCSKFCLPMSRRYTCDNSGNRVCLRGWSSPLCMTCAPGWFGRHCSVHCVTQKGRYTCDKIGNKICQRSNGWFGHDCSKYCVPVKERYLCDNLGNRMCHEGWAGQNCSSCAKGWYGPRCKTSCQPVSNRFSCDSKGKKVCIGVWTGPDCKTCAKGWFGPSCLQYCVPRQSNETGHYTCDKEGKKICSKWWHGPDCLKYCQPSDDEVNGHYTCDNKGNKVCITGYHGPKCLVNLFGNPS